MSEFDHIESKSLELDSVDSLNNYKLTGPPKALPIASAALLFVAFATTLFTGDSVLAFGLAVNSCLTTLASRAQNQVRTNKPSYSTTRWFALATTTLYYVGSFIALIQILMVAYVAGR